MNKELVIKQEEQLRFKKFNNRDALTIAMSIIERAENEGLKPIGIKVVYNGSLIFHYLMDGKNDSPWLDRKVKTVLESGHCSLYTYYHYEEKEEYQIWAKSEEYAVCGGGFPIIEGDEVKGAFCVSGLDHMEDHCMITEALENYLMK